MSSDRASPPARPASGQSRPPLAPKRQRPQGPGGLLRTLHHSLAMQRTPSLSKPRTPHRHHRAGGGCRRGYRQAPHARSPLAPWSQPPTEEIWCFLPKMTKSRTSPPDSLAAPRALPRRVQRPPLSRCGEHRHRQQPPLSPASPRSSTPCHRLNRHQTGRACRAPHQHHSNRSPESHPPASEPSLPAHHVA